MIDIKLLEKKGDSETSYYEEYRQSLLNRGADTSLLEQVISLNKQRKEQIQTAEEAKSKLNKVTQEIAMMKKKGEDASALISDMQGLSKSIKDLEASAAAADQKVLEVALTLPNKPQATVPVGKSAEDNKIVRTFGEPKKLPFKALEHNDLGEQLGILDFDRAGKVTGARFTFLKGAAARMERALIQMMMDMHSNLHGYTEMIPPFIVNSKSMTGTGQLPKFKEDLFALEGTDYFLIPTAEVPVTNYYNDEILSEEDLPKSYVAYSPCFRAEAGSHGRDTKGLIRQHQFNKVELMTFCHPEESSEAHEQLTQHAEKVLQALELPYRTMLLCTGDMGFGSARTYDLEVWLPGQNCYREISSCSNFEDFQARRAGIRFRPAGGGKPTFVHTLNGSGLAVGRTLIAVMENYQQEDGSVLIPKALQPYMGGLTKISK